MQVWKIVNLDLIRTEARKSHNETATAVFALYVHKLDG